MTKKPKEQEQVDKIKVISPEIIVTMMGARPYYEIKYFDISDCKWHIGYSSYDLKNVIEWKNECFEVIDTNDGWIPCSVRLPEKGRKVLLQTEGSQMTVAFLDKKLKWYVDSGDYFCTDLSAKPIAWQPLPEPYKGE